MSTLVPRKILFLSILMLALASLAQAECYIGGEITAEPNTDPACPAWKYTVTIGWDTGTQYALSHLDMLLDSTAGTCTCADLCRAVVFSDTPGTSEGEGGCIVTYENYLNCNGDPSIPDVEGIVLKFEPIETECEPGTTGTFSVVFYSREAPAPIDQEMLLLFDKFGRLNCSGYLSGVFPGLSCDPVATDATSWEATKGFFR